MTEKTLTEVPFKCHYCHQKTYMEVIGGASRELNQSYSGSNEDIKKSYRAPYRLEATWNILLCPNCDNANVLLGAMLDGELVGDSRIIYPPAITYTAPADIDLQFRSAIGVGHTSPAAAVNQFRMVLEMIWQNSIPEGTPKPKLRGNSGMIQQLVKANVLSGNYADMADVLASIGNAGSHNNEVEVTREDAEMARKLCQTILEHVYRMQPEGLELMRRIEKKFPRDSGWRDGKYVERKDW